MSPNSLPKSRPLQSAQALPQAGKILGATHVRRKTTARPPKNCAYPNPHAKPPKTPTLLPPFSCPDEGLSVLEGVLGYQFQQSALLKQALTHRSFDTKHNYERLEFLGDALLGTVIADYLYHAYPALNEGQLTRMRAALVRQKTLAQLAENLALYRYMMLGAGERKGGGRHRASILADVVEAIIGAMYLDSGDFATVKRCVLAWYNDLLTEALNDGLILKDAKSRLQEWLQARHLPLPIYELLEVVGTAPEQMFVVCCRVGCTSASIQEKGPSRRIAEQKCAELMINQLHLHGAMS